LSEDTGRRFKTKLFIFLVDLINGLYLDLSFVGAKYESFMVKIPADLKRKGAQEII
jgi:hypothetical protein